MSGFNLTAWELGVGSRAYYIGNEIIRNWKCPTWIRMEDLTQVAVAVFECVDGWRVQWGDKALTWGSDIDGHKVFPTPDEAKAACDERLVRLGYRLGGAAPNLLEVMMAVAPHVELRFDSKGGWDDFANHYSTLVRVVAESFIAEAALPVGSYEETMAKPPTVHQIGPGKLALCGAPMDNGNARSMVTCTRCLSQLAERE